MSARLVRSAGLVALAGLAGTRARAQMVTVGVQGVVGDYREASSQLRYAGTGIAGLVTFSRGKLSADLGAERLRYHPASGAAAVDTFTATQVDAHLRWYLASGVSAEIGFLHRSVDPAFTAQEVGAFRAGVRARYGLGPWTDIALRANYLAGAKFSGGGSAPFGIELGLAVGVGLLQGRLRLAADYEFQRLDRKTSVPVPIEQSIARIGIGTGFF